VDGRRTRRSEDHALEDHPRHTVVGSHPAGALQPRPCPFVGGGSGANQDVSLVLPCAWTSHTKARFSADWACVVVTALEGEEQATSGASAITQ
jgi:hypothetical protein